LRKMEVGREGAKGGDPGRRGKFRGSLAFWGLNQQREGRERNEIFL